MTLLLIGTFALAWSAACTFGLARILARTRPPRRAARTAWYASAIGNGALALGVAPGEPLSSLVLVFGCHLILLPILLTAAHREVARRVLPEA